MPNNLSSINDKPLSVKDFVTFAEEAFGKVDEVIENTEAK
jgi:hypothetical protein